MNTLVASDYMVSNGAVDIQVVERDSTIGHFQCAQPSILLSKFWFDTMADFCSDNVGISGASKKGTISMYPNPSADGWIQFTNDQEVNIRVLTVMGQELMAPQVISAQGVMDITGLQKGIVLIEIRQGEMRTIKPLVVQ